MNQAEETFSDYKRLFITALLVFAADQLSKIWIYKNLDIDLDYITIIEGFFYIVHVGNEGAAWGMFSGFGTVLTLFALLALIAIYYFRDALMLRHRIIQILFGLIIGGIVGNALDRQLHGHVIDFLDFHFPFEIPVILPNGHYPTFNIADCGIVIGTLSYITLSFFLPQTTPLDPAE